MNNERETLLDALLLCYEEIREEREEDWAKFSFYDDNEDVLYDPEYWDWWK